MSTPNQAPHEPAPATRTECPDRATTGATILLVEDNPITLAVTRAALERGGYRVVEAEDGHSALRLLADCPPDLVLQDLLLPDMDGFELSRRLRAASGGDLPIVAFSSLANRLDEAQRREIGYAAYLPKPLEPRQLRQSVEACLMAAHLPRMPGRRPRIVVADDETASRDLLTYLLEVVGCEATSARDGAEALAMVRRLHPDAVVADALMPELDGFRLCQALHADPDVAAPPVILYSAVFTGAGDEQLARDVGASRFVPVGDGFIDVVRAVVAVVHEQPPAAFPLDESLDLACAVRAMRHIEKLVARNAELTRRTSMQSAALAMLSGMADRVHSEGRLDDLLGDSFKYYLDAAGVGHAALYLERDGIPRLTAEVGYAVAEHVPLREFFGHADLLGLATREKRALLVPSSSVDPQAADDLLARARTRTMLLIPLQLEGEALGVLVLGSPHSQLEDGVVEYARALALQLAQAVTVARAMTRLSFSERAREESEMRYRALAEAASDAILVLDERLAVVSWNRGAEALFGYGEDEACGMGFEKLLSPPEGSPLIQHVRGVLLEDLPPGGSRRVTALRRDGSEVPVEVAVGRFVMRSRPYCSAIVRDESERHNLETQLHQSQKMEAMGQLAGGIAHDFNNLLTAMTGYSEIMTGSLDADDPRRQYMTEIQAAAARAVALTGQLLTFSRRKTIRPTVVDLNTLVEGADKLLRRLIGADVTLKLDLSSCPCAVRADAGQIDQVLLNLAVNARDAMPHGGTLRLATRPLRLEADDLRGVADAQPGRYAALQVSDTGEGMDEQTMSRVFEPFFTTKEPGRGTGLGLSTVYGIVRQCGGHIRLTSQVGKGTTFRVYLPMLEEDSTPQAIESPVERVRGGRETVLVVEDEDQVRTLMASLLLRLGYQVLEAADGHTALRLCDQHPGPIHLMLTDTVLPGLSGTEVAKRARDQRPDLRIIMTSGYLDDEVARRGAALEGDAFLQKPFRMEVLARRVREVLDRERPPQGPSTGGDR